MPFWILQLKQKQSRPCNPFVNTGAIVPTDTILAGNSPKEVLGEMLRFVHFAADDDNIHFDRAVAQSERDIGYRNFAFRVDLPGKSGAGGGIFTIIPGIGSAAFWAPGFNTYGKSKLGTEAKEQFARVTS